MYLFIDDRYSSRKNTMVGGSTLVIHDCRRVLLDAVQWRDPFISATLIATPIWFLTTMLVCETQIMVIKFDRRKSMRAADEKLITFGSSSQPPFLPYVTSSGSP